LCFILLCSKYTYCIYMYVKVKLLLLWLGDAFNVFWRNEWYVSRIVYSKYFDLFDVHN